MVRAPRTGWVLAAALLTAHASLWILLPSNDVHHDALDELLALERGHLGIIAKHPASAPTLDALLRGLRALGYEGRAIRPVQIWNGMWTTCALGAVLFIARRTQPRWTAVTAGTATILAGMYATLRFAVDPYLDYYPPGLALMSWGLAFSVAPSCEAGAVPRADRAGDWSAATACLVAAVLFNPMTAAACPVSSLLWSRRARPARGLVRILGPSVGPLGTLLAFLWVVPAGAVLRGPFGIWSEDTPATVWLGLRNAFVWSGRWFVPALQGDQSVPALLVTAAYLGLPIASAAALVLAAASRRAMLRFAPFGLAAAGTAAFVAWFDPANHQLWVLPVWWAGLGVIRAQPAGAGSAESALLRVARLAGGVLLLEGCLLLAANGSAYVWPAATGPNRSEQRAQELARQLLPQDAVVLLDFPDPSFAYYAEVRCSGIVIFYMLRQPGRSTFDSLEQEYRRAKRRGGSVYIEVPRAGRDWISEFVRRRLPDRDFEAADFERLHLGRQIEAGDVVLRRIHSFASGD